MAYHIQNLMCVFNLNISTHNVFCVWRNTHELVDASGQFDVPGD